MKLKIFGITVTVTFPFAAIILFLCITDKNGLVPLILLFALLHEMGHLCMMKLFKCMPEKIVLSAIGASLVWKSRVSVKKEAIILFAGPAVNLILSATLFLFDLPLLSAINLSMGFFNLLPVASFDGCRILKLICMTKFSVYNAERIIKAISVVTLFLSVLSAVFGIITGFLNFTVLITALYMLIIEISRVKY